MKVFKDVALSALFFVAMYGALAIALMIFLLTQHLLFSNERPY